jgi:hypothetical protein
MFPTENPFPDLQSEPVPEPTPELRVKQIAVAQWRNSDNVLSHSTFALGEDGKVYRFDVKCNGWMPLPMNIVHCRSEHKNNR